jgi:HSP20 family protein
MGGVLGAVPATPTSSSNRPDKDKREKNSYQSEISYGSFRRSLPLPQEVDPDSISAEYNNGVLTVTMKKTQPSHAKHIEVKEAGKN